jgi:4'-phosphopantetheinyl transferase
MDLYITDVRELEDEHVFWNGMQMLSLKRRESVLQCRKHDDRLRGLGAGLLLEYGLQRCGMTLQEETESRTHISMTKGMYGKPYLKGTSLQFNLSHAGNYAAAVFADDAVGIDIEKIRTANLRLVSRFFSGKEQIFWKQLEQSGASAEEGNLAFTRIWTRKESYIKAVGEGMHMSLSGFSVVGENGIWENPVKCEKYEIRTWEQPDEYIVSVCGVKIPEIVPVRISLKEEFAL